MLLQLSVVISIFSSWGRPPKNANMAPKNNNMKGATKRKGAKNQKQKRNSNDGKKNDARELLLKGS